MNAHMSGYMRTLPMSGEANMLRIQVIYREMSILIVYKHIVCLYHLTANKVYVIGLLMTNLAKKKTLIASGTLNPHPEAVRSELFKMDFFDPLDRAQVKYEMLRSHVVDGDPIAEACRQFGFSRESFYQIQEAFHALGFISFLPGKRGRKGPVKLKGEVLEFALEKKKENPEINPAQLVALIRERFGLEMNRTTVMRGMKKKRRSPAEKPKGRIQRRRRPDTGNL
jgi:transposase